MNPRELALAPAFPQTPDAVSWGRGMTLRDYFAAKAMQSLLRDSYYASDDHKRARAAYSMADAMMKARDE